MEFTPMLRARLDTSTAATLLNSPPTVSVSLDGTKTKRPESNPGLSRIPGATCLVRKPQRIPLTTRKIARVRKETARDSSDLGEVLTNQPLNLQLSALFLIS